MNWTTHVRSEFARLGKQVDESAVEELAQHAAAASERAHADGQSPNDADVHLRALVTSWCEATSGPRRIERAPLIEAAPAGRPSPHGAARIKVAVDLKDVQPTHHTCTISVGRQVRSGHPPGSHASSPPANSEYTTELPFASNTSRIRRFSAKIDPEWAVSNNPASKFPVNT